MNSGPFENQEYKLMEPLIKESQKKVADDPGSCKDSMRCLSHTFAELLNKDELER